MNTYSLPRKPSMGFSTSTAEVTFFGHTHHQEVFSYQDSQLEVLQNPTSLRANRSPHFALSRRTAIS